MHKMRIAFHKELALENKINSDAIISEVEDLGFGATLINTHEIINMSERGSVDHDEESGGDNKVFSKKQTT